MLLNEWIDNVPARHTAPSFHPHRNAALPDIDQVIVHHETVTSGALHGVPPLFILSPRLRRYTHSPSKLSRRVASRYLQLKESNRGATNVVEAACVF